MNSNSVFIGNLAWTVTDEILKAFAESAGEVSSAVVMRHNDTHRSKGWGIVEFCNTETAEQAVTALNGSELQGRSCHARLDRESSKGADAPFAMYVGNIPWSITSADLLLLFAAYSPAVCHVLTNMYGRSRGFAIMKFYTEEPLLRAINEMNRFAIQDRNIECRIDRGPGRSEELTAAAAAAEAGRTDVFVGKVDADLDEEALQLAFAHIGAITDVTIARHPDGNSKGWGIVKFVDPKDAATAVATMDAAVIARNRVAIKVKFDRTPAR